VSDLTLMRNNSKVLVTAEGATLPPRVFVNALGISAVQSGSGEYRLTGIPSGAPTIIRARGFVPVCLNAPRESAVQVALKPSKPIMVSFPVVFSGPLPGLVDGLPGSQCSVKFSAFSAIRIKAEGDGSAFAVDGLPASGKFTWRFGELTREIVLPPSGLIVLGGGQ
jgi:hypothetical protein